MEFKYLLVGAVVVFLLATTEPSTSTSTGDGDSEPPVTTDEPRPPLQAAAEAAVVNNAVPPESKRVIYINQCATATAADSKIATTTTTRKPFSELDSPREHQANANKKEIEFSTKTTVYRLRIMDTPLICANGAQPTSYSSKDEGDGSDSEPGPDHGPNADDYEYYDDDHELAALVVNEESEETNLLKLIHEDNEEAPSSQPQTATAADSPAAAANTVPNSAKKKQHELYIIADGRLQIDSVYYEIEDYCIKSFNGPVVKVLACDRICAPPEFPCIRKCCEFGFTFDIGQGSCVKSNSTLEWSPAFYEPTNASASNSNRSTSQTKPTKPHFQIEMPTGCKHGFDIWPFEFGDNLQLRGLQEYTKLRLLQDGSVEYLSRNRKWHSLNQGSADADNGDNFCVESGELIPNLTQNQMIIKCSHASYSQEIGIITLLIAVLYSIGAIFLTVITTLFILLWDDTANVHTWAVFIEIVILLLHYITLTSIYYLILNVNSTFWILGSSACVVLGVFSHFTYTSIFSWMAILNYDFWLTFNTKCSDDDSKAVATSKLRFFVYFLLGFGVPGLVIGFGLLMDHLYADPESGIMTPAYGQYFACAMSRWAEGVYMYVPIGLLYIVSLVFMVRTHYLINETKKSRNNILWRSDAEQERAGPAGRVRLGKYWWYAMLFNVSIICGLTWIVQIISFIVFQIKSNAGDTTISAAGTSLIYVSISDLVVGIQPIGICIIFLIQHRVWKQLTTKYGLCRRFNNQVNKWTAGVGGAAKLSKPVIARKQRYDLKAEGATHEEMISMVDCCKEVGPTIDSVIPSSDYLDGKKKRADESPDTSIESISYKCLPDPDRETNV